MKKLGTLLISPTGKALAYAPRLIVGLRILMPGMSPKSQNPTGLLSQFPSAPVKVGDTWKGHTGVGEMGLLLFTFTLNGVDTAGGRTVALIGLTGRTGGSPPGLWAGGSATESGTLHFGVDAGVVVDQTTHLVITQGKRRAEFDVTLTRVPGAALDKN